MLTARQIKIILAFTSPVWLLILFLSFMCIYEEYFDEAHWRHEYAESSHLMYLCSVSWDGEPHPENRFDKFYTRKECERIQQYADKWSMKVYGEPYYYDYEGNFK